jgi:hypothetical protein
MIWDRDRREVVKINGDIAGAYGPIIVAGDDEADVMTLDGLGLGDGSAAGEEEGDGEVMVVDEEGGEEE